MTAHSKRPETENMPVRVFLNEHCQGTFICPACGNSVIKSLGDQIHGGSAVRIKCKCKCGHVFPAVIEQRHFFRKPSDFMGGFTYRGGNGPPQKGVIRITDISQSGMQFSLTEAPSFRVGDRLSIEFRLNDKDQTRVLEDGTVLRIQHRNVGLRFDSPERYGKLGQYLML